MHEVDLISNQIAVAFGKRLIVSHTTPKKTSESEKKLLKFWLPRQSIDRYASVSCIWDAANFGAVASRKPNKRNA
jgi:hypothetical protein